MGSKGKYSFINLNNIITCGRKTGNQKDKKMLHKKGYTFSFDVLVQAQIVLSV